MSRIGARLKRIECRVILTNDQRRFERLKRRHYNAFQVSDAALIESLVSAFEGKEPPDWVEREFQELIPYGSDKDRISEAEAWAHEVMSEAAGPAIYKQCTRRVQNSPITEAKLATHLNTVLGYVQDSNLEGSEGYISRLRRLMGEGSICRPSGP